MPPLQGFSDNPIKTRSDLITAALALISPLEPYKSPEKARIKVSTASGAGFSEVAAQVEGFARPLWVVADLVRLQAQGEEPTLRSSDVQLQSWIEGLKAGTDPESPEYWGQLLDIDQKMVEMESMALAIIINPSVFAFEHDPRARENLVNWLSQINNRKMPVNNWRWFRVFVNLALTRSLGVPRDNVQKHIDEDLAILDSFYMGEGWYSDGPWGDVAKQADYYSGSFAIQYAQLLFVAHAADFDPERAEKYRSQAREFATKYWRYFDAGGAAIPFGRSLTYRFAFAAFWAAAGVAGIELPAPLDSPGVVKGLLLRHIRWWAKQPHIFNTDGTLNIGYAYPNMYMSEDYNSPQSVYWCLKSFIAVGIDKDSTFWTCEELPYPKIIPELPAVALVWPPRHILCCTSEHHFMLSSGQSTRKPHKSREAKYSKFAYSSAFTFSVPIGSLLEQVAPDSVLCLSKDGGETWTVRSESHHVSSQTLTLGSQSVPVLVSSWKPWSYIDLVVETKLIPPLQKWPGWHLRVHVVRWTPSSTRSDALEPLLLLDSGFGISAQTSQDQSIFDRSCSIDFAARGEDQGWWMSEDSALIKSEAGASGSIDLSRRFGVIRDSNCDHQAVVTSKGKIIRPNANTNLVAQRSLIPSIQHVVQSKSAAGENSNIVSFHLITGIFAVDRIRVNDKDAWSLWKKPPMGRFDDTLGQIILE